MRLEFQYLFPVSTATLVRHMHPRKVLFINQLVEWKVAFDVLKEFPVLFPAPGCDVGSLALQVLRVCGTSHQPIQLRATVTAVHVDRFPVPFTQRVKYVVGQSFQVEGVSKLIF